MIKGGARRAAVRRRALDAWLRNKLPQEMSRPSLKDHVETLVQLRAQDLEPDQVNHRRVNVMIQLVVHACPSSVNACSQRAWSAPSRVHR